MRGSLRLGRFLGIDLFVHWTFGVFIAWILFSAVFAGGTAMDAVMSTGFVLAVFGCVVLHEYGHALMARRYGIPTQDITLLPIGGVARLERMPEEPRQELLIAVAGPLVNVVIAGALAGWIYATEGGITLRPDLGGSFVESLLAVNIALVVFNVLPAFPMDGGRILRALLAMRMSYVRATHVAASLGQGMAILFAALGLFVIGNIVLPLVALFIFFAARAEAKAVWTRSLLRGMTVRDAMMTNFQVLSMRDSLQQAADLLLAGAQQDFPVVDGPELRGMLRRDDLIAGLREGGVQAPVAEFMWDDATAVDERAWLDETVQRMQSHGEVSLPVVRRGELVGLLTAENVSEVIMLRAARDAEGDEELLEPEFLDDPMTEQQRGRDEWRHRIGDPPVSAGH